MHLNNRETETILFALRCLQASLDVTLAEYATPHFIGANGDALPDPTEAFIDELCEKMNNDENTMTHYEWKIEEGGEYISPWSDGGDEHPFDYHFLSEREARIAKDDWAPDEEDWVLVKVTTEVIPNTQQTQDASKESEV